MPKKSKLLSALDAHKGRNYALEHQVKLQKAAAKRKRSRAEKEAEERDEEDVEQSVSSQPVLVFILFLIWCRSRTKQRPMARN